MGFVVSSPAPVLAASASAIRAGTLAGATAERAGEGGAAGAGRPSSPAATGAAAPVRAVVAPPALVEVDVAIRVALAAAERAHEWDAAGRAAVLAWIARHRDLLAVLEGKVLTAERNAGTWSLQGDRDLAAFIGRTSRQGRGAGLAAVGQAGTLAAMPAVAQALADGPVTTSHVAQLTRATAASPVLAAELVTPEGQGQVVELARRLDGQEFGKALSQLSASLDPAERQRSHDEQRAARSFAWTHTSSGTLLKGRLDSVAGHMLAKAIDALSPRPAADDDQSREQRHADALVAIAERVLTDRTTTPGAVAPVQAVVSFTQETWAALRAARPDRRGHPDAPGNAAPAPGANDVAPAAGSRGGAPATGSKGAAPATASAEAAPATCSADTAPAPGSAQDVIDRLRDTDPVVDETGLPWPASEIARALCDCTLTRAMVAGRDAELNLGRGERCFGRQHWMALYAAGITSCSINGCGMPLAYTELHHLRWWTRDGGRTDLANCAPYCSFHHHEVHRLGIVATRRPDGTIDHRHPDGRPYGGAPTAGAPTAGAPTAGAPTAVAPTADAPRAGGHGPAGSLHEAPVSSSSSSEIPPGSTPRAGPTRTVGGARPADGPPMDLIDLLTG
jgi:hypothetical protein